MDPATCFGGEGQVALDDGRFRAGRPRPQAEACGDGAAAHDRSARQAGVLGVLDQRHAQRGEIEERPAGDRGRRDRGSVVAHGHGAGGDQGAVVGQVGALAATGRRGDDPDPGTGVRGASEEAFNAQWLVERGVGVGHGADVRVTTGSGRRQSRRDVLLVLLAGLAKMRVQIDERRQYQTAGRVDDPVLGRALVELLGDRHHPAVLAIEIRDVAIRRGHDLAPLDQETHDGAPSCNPPSAWPE